MPDFNENANIPYLFTALSDEEKASVFELQDFMKKHKDEMPLMSAKAMMHFLAVQLSDIINAWKIDVVQQKEAMAPVTEEDRRMIVVASYAQFIAFILAHKDRLADSNLIIDSVVGLLNALYGGTK